MKIMAGMHHLSALEAPLNWTKTLRSQHVLQTEQQLMGRAQFSVCEAPIKSVSGIPEIHSVIQKTKRKAKQFAWKEELCLLGVKRVQKSPVPLKWKV